jgi:hypothetical protein
MLNMQDDQPLPFSIRFKGTSVKAARQLISYAWQKRKSLFDISCSMSLTETVNDKGKFYVVNFSDFEMHEPGTYLGMFKEFQSYDIGSIADQEAPEPDTSFNPEELG